MTTLSVDTLFRPFRIGALDLPNRIVMSPMTRPTPPGVPGEEFASYFSRRAEHGVGLILSGGAVVERPASRNDDTIPLFHGREALAGWKGVIGAVHRAGGRMGPQLAHLGGVKGKGSWDDELITESPSGFGTPGEPRGETMSEEAIADTIAAFARAAGEAKRLGFDVVELNAAHGYLLDQFFWARTNHRTDRWGGATLRERTRFTVETIRAARAAVGPDFPIIVRVSQWKLSDYKARHAETPELLADWLEPLVEAGADVLHCSQRRFWEPEFPEIDGPDGLNLAGWAKKITGAATMSVGSVGLSGELIGAFAGESSKVVALDKLIARMERDEFDLIAVGRALLADPLWVEKVRAQDQAGLKGFDPSALAHIH